jgi:transglutaminase-like putative cysteine protease
MRTIDKRFLPGVAGVDLEQSLNYIDLADVGEAFVYDKYTGARLPYAKGSRPSLEALAKRLTLGAKSPLEKVQKLTAFVASEVKWAGFYKRDTGKPLPPDRDLDEEELIVSGYGWCNEQARVLCALTQVLGIPSRLVFACNLKKKYGHVVTEVLLPDGWMTVDESLNYCFLMNGKPVRASRIWNDANTRAYCRPRDAKLCTDLIGVLGRPVLTGSFNMSLGPDPLDGFSAIGYHNCFVL